MSNIEWSLQGNLLDKPPPPNPTPPPQQQPQGPVDVLWQRTAAQPSHACWEAFGPRRCQGDWNKHDIYTWTHHPNHTNTEGVLCFYLDVRLQKTKNTKRKSTASEQKSSCSPCLLFSFKQEDNFYNYEMNSVTALLTLQRSSVWESLHEQTSCSGSFSPLCRCCLWFTLERSLMFADDSLL